MMSFVYACTGFDFSVFLLCDLCGKRTVLTLEDTEETDH